MAREKWSVRENEICCKVCVDEYVIAKKATSVDDCIKIIKSYPEISQRDISSIRMKIQNIKALFEEWKVPNTLLTSPSTHASRQNRAALKAYLKDMQKITIPLSKIH